MYAYVYTVLLMQTNALQVEFEIIVQVVLEEEKKIRHAEQILEFVYTSERMK